MIKNLKLGHRLIISFMVLAFIVGLTGAFGAFSMKRVSNNIHEMMQNLANQQKLILLMGVTQKVCHVSLLEAALVRHDKQKFEEHAEDYRTKSELLKSQCEIILRGNNKLGVKAASEGSEIAKRTNKVLQNWAAFDEVAEKLLATKKNLLEKAVAPAVTLADDNLHNLTGDKLTKANDKAKEAVDDLLVAVGMQIDQAHKETNMIQQSTGMTFVTVIVLAIILAGILGILTSNNLVKRINTMGQALDQGAEGDLTTKLQDVSGDELGKLAGNFNSMVDKLSVTIKKVNVSAGELNNISDEIADATRLVSSAANLQVDSVNKTSLAVNEINDSIIGVAQGVDNLSLSASESSSSILEMAASIEEVALNMENLTQSVEEVSSSIIQMAASIKQVDKGVVTLMEASNTTASSVMDMDTSIKQVESSAQETAAISEEVRKDAEIGKRAVDATISGIKEIKRSSRITSEVIDTLSAKTEDIGTILSVIDEVAEQTNLLALNAAIIAAQSGEHGKGFAVVADEIKELAERTSSSTREIALVIKGVQDETCRAVEAISEAEKSISDGELLSKRSGEALIKVVEGVKKATERMAEIANVTVEQSRGSQVIRDAMERVSEMVEQIAKATREQGQGSELITASVERMKDLTSQVRNSTREQSNVGNFIAQSTENITAMIQQIKQACDEQSSGSSQIVVAMKDIQRSTQTNLDAANVMNQAVNGLFEQARVLKKEMEVFKI